MTTNGGERGKGHCLFIHVGSGGNWEGPTGQRANHNSPWVVPIWGLYIYIYTRVPNALN